LIIIILFFILVIIYVNGVNEAFRFFYYVNACQWDVNGVFASNLLILCYVNDVNDVNGKNRL